MDKIREIISRKPITLLLASVIYLLVAGFLKWRTAPSTAALFFLGGGLLGIYFLDLAEVFFRLTPSPFRSVVFAAAFVAVALFIVTSSGSMFATGLVLSMHFSLVLWQIGEWQYAGNLNSWYRMVAGPVTVRTQQILLFVFVGFFIAETFVFVR